MTRALGTLVLVVLSLVAGCGGGGGGVGGDGDPVVFDLELLWAVTAGREAPETVGRGVATFLDGTSAVTGTFVGSAVFGPGDPNETALASTAATSDVFVARYTVDGDLDWARATNGTGEAVAEAISGASDGSVFVTGTFDGTVVFGDGEANETTLVASGRDAFVARYGANGTLAWARALGGTLDDAAFDVAAQATGFCFVVGEFRGTAAFGGATLVSDGGVEGFVARVDPAGDVVWARRIGGVAGAAPDARAAAVGLFPDGSLAVAGRFSGATTFAPGEGNATTLTAVGAGSTDAFVARYENGGALTWVRPAADFDDQEAFTLGIFADGSVVVAGSFETAIVFDDGGPNERTLNEQDGTGTDGWLARWSGTGALVWARRLATGSTTVDPVAHGLAPFADGSFVLVGEFALTLFADGAGTTLSAPAGDDASMFVLFYTEAGIPLNAARIGGSDADRALDAAPFTGGEFLFTGTARTTPITFGLGDPEETTFTPAAGAAEMYLVRMLTD